MSEPRRSGGAAAVLGLLTALGLSVLPLGPGDGKHLALVALVALTVLATGRVKVPRGPLAVPLLIAAAWASLSLTWSADRHGGAVALLWLTALTLVAGIAASHGRVAVGAVAAAGMLFAGPVLAVGLAQRAGLVPHAWADAARLAGPFVNSNLYAAFTAVSLCLGLGVVLSHRRLSIRILATTVSALAGFSLLLTASRGGAVASGVGVAVLIGVRLRGGVAPRRLLAVGALAVVMAGVALALASRAGWTEEVTRRLRSAGDYSVGHRAAMYASTLAMIRAHPLGVGLGAYPLSLPRYRVHSDRFRVHFAHSDPLEALAVLGVPGFAALLLLAIRAGREVRRLRVAAVPAAAGPIAALSALAVHSCFDFPLRKPTLALLAAALAGALLGEATGRPSSAAGARLLAGGVFLLAVAGGAGALQRARAERLLAEQRLFEAAEAFEVADVWTLPRDVELARSGGALNARLARAPLLGATFLERARDWYGRAIARSPGDERSLFAAGVLAAAAGDPVAAYRLQLAAADRAPRDGTIVPATGLVAARHGDVPTALRLRGAGLELIPGRVTADVFAAEAAVTLAPAELVAAAVEPAGRYTEEAIEALADARLTLAAELIAARRAARWPPRRVAP